MLENVTIVHLRRMCILLLLVGVSVFVRANWSIMLFKSSVSLLVLCLDVIFFIESEILKSPSIIATIYLSLKFCQKICLFHIWVL